MLAAISAHQADYLAGRGPMRPFTAREVARRARVHESTVSRVLARDPLIEGVRARDLLSVALDASVSADQARDAIAALIAGEDPQRPFTDREIEDALAEQGIPARRRTCALYRDQLGIPSSHDRRRS